MFYLYIFDKILGGEIVFQILYIYLYISSFLSQLFTKALLGCVADLQRNMNVTPDLSPAWVMAAARHYTPRLDTLSHILLLQPHLASQIVQQGSKTEPSEMVRTIPSLSTSSRGLRMFQVQCD